ncbi:aminoacyl-tRNA hydrolase [Asticcacaulis sp. EMRT-3]|uniref:aminoacyl-tRNA hydrolase n=1 Tax=Asticcacaulis sp. EMRT-3 TaxID=3040349 RepID=UPI0024AEE160|nr:aminoacyl-tRNA hydrolase [Asticcacaulis sp. EMRT-3]MDI7774879.1 aminoacyl-tRNA hydrolase [Asticcacaulis sp. EMRT-3]
MYLLVGLGNPGSQYAGHRHNIGFMLIDELARDPAFGPEKKAFDGLVSEGAMEMKGGRDKVLLLKPQTFMNLSGNSVAKAMQFYKIRPDRVIVFHDELDLAPGRMRMKLGGGHAGHNGLRSIMQHIGPNFMRARMGIGHPGAKELVHDWVLSDFSKADQVWLKAELEACTRALPLLFTGLPDAADRYQAEVMRLAPAPKMDTRQMNADKA